MVHSWNGRGLVRRRCNMSFYIKTRFSMKHILVTIALVALAAPAMAVDLTCTLPAAYVTRGVELCEELRLRLHVRSSEWSNDVCSSEFLRIGMLTGDRTSTRLASQQTVSQAVNDAVDSFEINWPRLVAAQCGDGTLDTEFGETCDDGNNVDGDGCDESCIIEP